MGNIQTMLGPIDSEHPDNDDLSFSSSCSEDSEVLTPSDEHQSHQSRHTISIRGKVMCEYCREHHFPQFHDQHKRVCAANPVNIRINLENCSGTSSQRACQSELEKVPCEFCNEPCYVTFHTQHLRVCPKNPENIKINCRYCDRTLSSVLYNSHIDACEELHQHRRRSVGPQRRGRHCLETLRKVKTNNEIGLIEDYERVNPLKICKAVSECSICLEDIETVFDKSTLTCCHEFHRKCIDKWSRRQRRCPICRKDFF